MALLTGLLKRGVVGRPVRSDRLGETLLPKKIALPVFASDALSSVAYATEEILLVLTLGGISFIHLTPWVAVAVGILMLTVVTSYRQNVHAYPSGGGDYEVATTNLGGNFGLLVASALMVDYVLTVAVSVSSGVANFLSAVPSLADHRVLIAILVVVIITLLNLRGIRESGTAFAIPTYAFMVAVIIMIGYGLIRAATGTHLRAESANFGVIATSGFGGAATIFLVLRAFSSGCTALTGVEAISNGVPAFKKPKSKNAATTLLLLGGLSILMFAGVTALALMAKVHVAADSQLTGAPKGYEQRTVITQVAEAVFGGTGSIGFVIIAVTTTLILVLAANTAFNGFPVLASILAQDRYLPRQLHTRGDRLAFSNGIVLLSGFATLLIVAFSAEVTKLIQLYIIGVFVSFVCSQSGMVRHWNRLLSREDDPQIRRRMRRSQAINMTGAILTGFVLVIVLLTKFTRGAWIVCVAMPIIFMTMKAIRRHYDRVARELVPEPGPPTLPSRVIALVLVSKLHRPTLRALAFAKASRPHVLEAITVNIDDDDTKALQEEWHNRGITIDLVVIDSPFREITRPVIKYVRRIRRESPRDVVCVYIPEYVVGHWWENLLHNQSALRLKSRLLFEPGVMVTSVPYQLDSSERRAQLPVGGGSRAGDVRRGTASLARPGETPSLTKGSADTQPAPGTLRHRTPRARGVTRRPAAAHEVFELTVERPGPGGDCIGHAPDGRVVFIRGALPGETVKVSVTDSNKRFIRADTVEVITPSKKRVTPPCPLAVPGRCGGCDWQHAEVSAGRALKGEVLRDQLSRLGGVDPGPVRVLAAPSTPDGLKWRTRVQISVGRDGSRGLLRHRSHAVERVRSCPITHPLIDEAGAWNADGPEAHRVRHQPRLRVSFSASPTTGRVVVDDDGQLIHEALDHSFRVSRGGFWQVHPDAPELLAAAVLDALKPQPGERALDLYAGAGLFSYALSSTGASVTAVEELNAAAGDARANCQGLDVEVVTADVATALPNLRGPVDVVVLDPPRTGASPAIMAQLAAFRPRAIAYVSCDGATLARDLRAAGEAGYRLAELSAFDLFPMTAHLETLALLLPEGEPGAPRA